ncbi:hypothetical protein [Emticicia aquatilis]|uniref:hypothetical protein n=1 Tax=Emticicia aquatilis TaxID=1537369 RepID=UPI0016681695|nr:hypothetical protein [Emticicia aquatilis]
MFAPQKENAHQTAGILTYGVQQNHNKSTVLTAIVILLQKYEYFMLLPMIRRVD